jgi:hypothetical protein
MTNFPVAQKPALVPAGISDDERHVIETRAKDALEQARCDPKPRHLAAARLALAREVAIFHLIRLKLDVVLWTEYGPDTASAEKAYRHAVALLGLGGGTQPGVISAIQKGPKERHGHFADLNALRNQAITDAMNWVCQRHGLNPIRNPASSLVLSASEVVAKALRMLKIGPKKEKAVWEIWKQYRPSVPE